MPITLTLARNSPFHTLGYMIQEERQALAFDALTLLFETLWSATHKLNQNLVTIADKAVTDKVYNARPVRSVILDVWQILDIIHRAGNLFKHAQIHLTSRDEAVLNEIRLVRNSFHHLEDRIDEHFHNTPGSVLGNLSWFYRKNSGEPVHVVILVSGIGVTEREGTGDIQVTVGTPEETKDILGIADLDLHYVVKQGKVLIQKKVRIDEAVALMNEIIVSLEKECVLAMERLKPKIDQDPERHLGRGRHPFIFSNPCVS